MFLKSAKNELNISLLMLCNTLENALEILTMFWGGLAVGGVSYMQLRDQSGKWITFCTLF